MKKNWLFILPLTFVALFSQAQTTNDVVSSQNQLRMHYDTTFLNSKSKLELTKIYLEQVQIINNILPYAAFPIKGQVMSVNQIDIPTSKYTSEKREKVSSKVDVYNETMNKNLQEIIPYSDKNEIIKGIMFIQEMIEKIDTGL